ncbi:MAG: hypothetical protein A2992_09495 [Elusimicrobia bacterium RIFCSPLOWO2_01_FULL_59_12]|nr:MAG: hypothetical protein A2992_09495 [Elusimicrobia bacterium RIFCSPLOWO2_01_FULL_59_12]
MRYNVAVKKEKPLKPRDHPALLRDLPLRLAELEVELRLHAGRKVDDRPLKSISGVSQVAIGPEKAVQFAVGKKAYAAGHADITYADSNHARGVRHIRFYEAKKVVLDIEGDFEDQQLGSNFRFKNIDVYLPGLWEADLIKLTDHLRHHTSERKLAFHKKRAAALERLRRF